MALNWDITKCKEMVELQSETEWPITNAIIWYTIGVDLGEITEKNIGEFYARIKLWEAVQGATIKNYIGNSKTDDTYLSFEDVHKRIGLVSNVSDISRTKFINKVKRIMTENRFGHSNQLTQTEIDAILATAKLEAEKKMEGANA
jgi:hypothetical protein